MRLFGAAALVAALFPTTVIAGMEQLAAVLPSCAVGIFNLSIAPLARS
jgi:hypothetical protein